MTVSFSETNRPDGFHIGRLAALQPGIDATTFGEGVMRTEDPLLLNNVANLLRVWALSRHDTPDDFCEQLQVESVSRQPIGLIVTKSQHVERNLVEIEEPFRGGAHDNRVWSTRDLFELSPLETMTFPDSVKNETTNLPGEERISICTPCEGAGHTVCPQCEGDGNVACPDCGGAQRITCSRCLGAGTHLGTSGNYIQCQLCYTRGTVRCTRCVRGQVTCSGCVRGEVKCSRCDGAGNLLHRWTLMTITQTHCEQHYYLSESWPIATSTLYDDAEELIQERWAWPTRLAPPNPVQSWTPPELVNTMEAAIQSALIDESRFDTAKGRISGLSTTILGTYVYCVDFSYIGQQERLYIGGKRNQFFTCRETMRRRGILNKLGQFGRKMFRSLTEQERPVIDRTFLENVRNGRVHISDARCLIADVARILGVASTVSASGYSLCIPVKSTKGTSSRELTFEVELDINRQDLILCACYRIGPSQRDQYVNALALNNRLSFGRIATSTLPGTGQEIFNFVDRRRYNSISSEHYAQILMTAARELYSILEQRMLQ